MGKIVPCYIKQSKSGNTKKENRIGCNRHSQTAHGDEGLVQRRPIIPDESPAADWLHTDSFRLVRRRGFRRSRPSISTSAIRSGGAAAMRPLGGMCGKDDPRTPVNRVCLSGIIEIRQEGFSPAMSRGSLLRNGRRGARIRRRAGWSIIADKIK